MIERYLKEKRSIIDAQLLHLLPGKKTEPALIHEAMHYSIFAGGKRLRPVLVLAVGESLGADEKLLIEPACAIECIHTYSLIHDDLPCIDNDDLRRGKPTSHKVFGEATAVLAGDALLTWGFHLLADSRLSQQRPDIGMKVISCIAEAIGTRGMIGGQVLDISFEGMKVAADDIIQMDEMKTAKLIQAAVLASALAAEADDQQLSALRLYGMNIGLAFQIVDDILDVRGEAGQLGKAVKKDALAEKATLCSQVGIDEAQRKAKELIDDAMQSVEDLDRHKLLAGIAGFIIDRTH